MSRPRTWAVAAALVALAAVASSYGQANARRLTTIEGLRRFSGYFHLQNVILHGELIELSAGREAAGSTRPGATGGGVDVSNSGLRLTLRSGDSEMQVMLNDAAMVDGPVEVRAQLIDVGRLTASDPRLNRYQSKPDPDHWPMPGEDLVLSITSVIKVDPTPMPTIRTIALEPWKFEGQSVTVIGQFGGRNLFGDLPASPAKTRYDFVLRTQEGGVWVTGLRPKGKGFDLNVDARVDTSHWLQVTGALTQQRGLVVLEAKTIEATSAPVARVVIDEPPPPPKEPGEVVFSSPTDGETGVLANAPIRIQFSRGIDPPTLMGRLRISYLGGPAPPPEALNIDIKTTYDAGSHAVEVRPSKAFEPYRTVKIEILEGVKTFDGAPINPWNVTFSIGAN